MSRNSLPKGFLHPQNLRSKKEKCTGSASAAGSKTQPPIQHPPNKSEPPASADGIHCDRQNRLCQRAAFIVIVIITCDSDWILDFGGNSVII
jgi:hypothetical protein